ncbi:606_t:CDS:1, partial [Scutellospora calospora]
IKMTLHKNEEDITLREMHKLEFSFSFTSNQDIFSLPRNNYILLNNDVKKARIYYHDVIIFETDNLISEFA